MNGEQPLTFFQQLQQTALQLGTSLGESYIDAEFSAPIGPNDTNTETASGAGVSTDTVSSQPNYFGFVERNQTGLILGFGALLALGLFLKFSK